jgi:hypothetical protein
LKTYQTSLGFFDLAIAAPSMKAALEAWGADSNLFHQGAAKQSDDPDVVAATMAKPGVVMRRPVGSEGSFGEHAELPTELGEEIAKGSQAAIDTARREHEERAGAIEAGRAAIDKRAQAEEARWARQNKTLEAALRRARK